MNTFRLHCTKIVQFDIANKFMDYILSKSWLFTKYFKTRVTQFFAKCYTCGTKNVCFNCKSSAGKIIKLFLSCGKVSESIVAL